MRDVNTGTSASPVREPERKVAEAAGAIAGRRRDDDQARIRL